MNVGWGELVVILAIVLLLIGGRRLPELGRSVGEAIREFQRALRGGKGGGDQPKGPA